MIGCDYTRTGRELGGQVVVAPLFIVIRDSITMARGFKRRFGA
jgi:hypothetical protein